MRPRDAPQRVATGSYRTTAFHDGLSPVLMAHTDPATSDSTEHAMNALDTRDLTLPQRLWSWLTKQANDRKCSVDEVVAALIDTHRHPEQAEAFGASPAASSPEATASSSQEQPTQKGRTTTADRLREMSDRLSKLQNKDGGDDEPGAKGKRGDLREMRGQSKTARGDETSQRTAPSKKTSSEQQDPDTETLIQQAMQALHESDPPNDESDRPSKSNSGEASMFDVVRDEE